MIIIRRKDNPLSILAYSHGPGSPMESFDAAVYEQIEGELPEGWSQETAMTPADQLKAIYEAQDIEVQLGFYSFVPQVLTALQSNRPDIAKLIIERATIPVELEPVRAQMLSVFSGG